jgi:hypothetical protein
MDASNLTNAALIVNIFTVMKKPFNFSPPGDIPHEHRQTIDEISLTF